MAVVTPQQSAAAVDTPPSTSSGAVSAGAPDCVRVQEAAVELALVHAAVDPDDIIRQFDLSSGSSETHQETASELAALGREAPLGPTTEAPGGEAHSSEGDYVAPAEHMQRLREKLRAVQEDLAATRARARSAVFAAVAAASVATAAPAVATAQRQQKQGHQSAQPPPSAALPVQRQQIGSALVYMQTPTHMSYISCDTTLLELLGEVG